MFIFTLCGSISPDSLESQGNLTSPAPLATECCLKIEPRTDYMFVCCLLLALTIARPNTTHHYYMPFLKAKVFLFSYHWLPSFWPIISYVFQYIPNHISHILELKAEPEGVNKKVLDNTSLAHKRNPRGPMQ